MADEQPNILDDPNLDPQRRRWLLIASEMKTGKPLDQALTLAPRCETFMQSGEIGERKQH